MYCTLGISIVTAAAVDDISPFFLGECAPTNVFCVATITYSVISPIGLTTHGAVIFSIIEILRVQAIGIIIASRSACAPWLVTVCTVIIATRTPVEVIYPFCLAWRRRGISINIADIVILMLSETPSIGWCLILQVALWEHNFFATDIDGKKAR